MIKTQYIRVRRGKSIKLDMEDMEKRGKKPERLERPPVMSQIEKEARIYALAKKLGVKIGGAK